MIKIVNMNLKKIYKIFMWEIQHVILTVTIL